MCAIFKILTFNFFGCICLKDRKKRDISGVYNYWKQINIKLAFKYITLYPSGQYYHWHKVESLEV